VTTVEEVLHLIFQIKAMVLSVIMICLLYNRFVTLYLFFGCGILLDTSCYFISDAVYKIMKHMGEQQETAGIQFQCIHVVACLLYFSSVNVVFTARRNARLALQVLY